jgi:hypothetical protein
MFLNGMWATLGAITALGASCIVGGLVVVIVALSCVAIKRIGESIDT